jgi:hypothetical protein
VDDMSELKSKGKSGTNGDTGYQFMNANPAAEQYEPSVVSEADLPRKVDLRPFMTPVENQGSIGSCTANAIAGAYEYLIKRHLQGAEVDISRLFIYYNARWRAGNQNKVTGSRIQYGMESLQTFGACTEKSWPYNVKAVLEKAIRLCLAARYLIPLTIVKNKVVLFLCLRLRMLAGVNIGFMPCYVWVIPMWMRHLLSGIHGGIVGVNVDIVTFLTIT